MITEEHLSPTDITFLLKEYFEAYSRTVTLTHESSSERDRWRLGINRDIGLIVRYYHEPKMITASVFTNSSGYTGYDCDQYPATYKSLTIILLKTLAFISILTTSKE